MRLINILNLIETPVNNTETPEFQKWFGNSKIIADGKPLIVYHATNKNLLDFLKIKLPEELHGSLPRGMKLKAVRPARLALA